MAAFAWAKLKWANSLRATFGLATLGLASLMSTAIMRPAAAQLTPMTSPAPAAAPAQGLVPLSSSVPTVTPTIAPTVTPTATPAATANFSFTNVLQYSDCLSAILDLYQGNAPADLPTRQNACAAAIEQASKGDGLSEIEARQLVSAADFYSSHFLSRALYPPKGLRLRVAQMLGYVYQIDQNDPEVLRQAARS